MFLSKIIKKSICLLRLKGFLYPKKMSDYLDTLPTDNNAPTAPELQIVDYLFNDPSSKKEVKSIVGEFKTAIWASVLFVLLSLPIVDSLMIKFVGICNNTIVRTIIKAIVYMLVFYFVNNLWIVKIK